MNTVTDYESLWMGQWLTPPVLEAYRGSDIVTWHGQIEAYVDQELKKYEAARNHDFVERLRKFLQIWTENPIDENINAEVVLMLSKVCDVESSINWEMRPFFRSLRDKLKRIVAVERELPRNDVPAGAPLPGMEEKPKGPRLSGSKKPSSEFGPEKEKPPGEEGEPEDLDGAVDTGVNQGI